MLKSDLRKTYKLLRNNLSVNDIEDLSLEIANKLLKLPIWDYSFYHIFLAISEQKEVDTDFILNILSGKDKHIVVSKSDFKTGEMINYLLTDSTLIKKNSYNIPEPVDGIEIAANKIDVVFIPLLAFDQKGNRVGYGKGFYDRFLSQCKPETIKIGLSFFDAELQIQDVHNNDITLDYCVTPKNIYTF
ncbi:MULTISPECIES: 5-formyltetrahydrofolate cyclo-ligase [Aestuariibaculum]|uniref:5-formyltetrahydrofolate cyclo-ligase n=1 Tax=Aestuariibaculum lutulentum TaxID=2920935 RepID=A0ABS9RG47_9FLAO|nr:MULTISPECIES: 5-formyltetrahydrofolate cyclo-ligase [Aestuariibaculum]MCH4551923.1 5-formyltetrahydrofolate cyclo-ligase [Aestuariibaculum lutulentum]MCR8667030.1 5-formyltetrahydrofolate cyclo-ligase [Aestuariibaculum sp. M13]